MTARGWTARQPDGTSVGELPLRQRTINRLRVGGVMTLGELRAMADHELLQLWRFGDAALADVRSLVPAPAVSGGGEVTIVGRAFTLGAVYAPRRGGHHAAARRLMDYSTDSPMPGGRVTVAVQPSGRREIMAGMAWAAWAGEPVGDAGR